MQKVNYKNFANTDMVGGLQRTLVLDKSQFEGLPSDTLELTAVRTQLHDNDEGLQISNVVRFDLIGRDIKAIKEMKDLVAKLPKSVPEASKQQLLSSVPDNVDIRVDITNYDGTFAENAQQNYDFIVSTHDLLNSGVGKVLSGIEYGVTWGYATRSRDKLALVATDLSGVKVK